MKSKQDVAVDVSASSSLLQRRIDFHMARKPLASSSSGGNFKFNTMNPCTSSPSTQSLPLSTLNKPNGNDVPDSVHDPDLTLRIPFRRIGAGLENLGNTCFLNSVLQCLTYTEPLVAYLQSGKHQNTCHIAGFCALCAINKHVSRALESTGRILAPKYLVSNLKCISRSFRNARQQDAHEYMIHLLESMHKCCLPSGLPAESSGAYEKSLVHKIFGGRLRSQVKCLRCSYCSDTFDPFLDLSLEIVKADSLYKALMHFTAAEQLDGGESQYKCGRCMHKVKACKQLTIFKAPFVLAIHLKRFRSYLSGQKIDKRIHFDSKLDLKPFVSGVYEGDLTYTLYGVLVHAGWSTHSGHYYCFVRTSSGLWYSLDDNRVVQVSERTVLEQKAYMLFYVRDRKTFTPKRAMDVIQKEDLVTAMQNASSSCSMPSAKIFQSSCADNNAKEAISFSKASEVQLQNISQSAIQPSSDGGVCKKGVPGPAIGTLSIMSKSRSKLPNTNGSRPIKSPSTLRRQSMKKIPRSSVVGLRLSTKMLYGTSLSLRKREECRRMKRSKKRALQEQLLGKDLVSGSSTSDKISGAMDKCMDSHVTASSSSWREGEKDAAKKGVTCKGTLLESAKLPQESASSFFEANNMGDSDFTNSKKLYCQLQNGGTIAGTRGLEEIAVGHWDGPEYSSKNSKSNGQHSFSIGYVPDDWDEEYDRGKRKKVRGPRF